MKVMTYKSDLNIIKGKIYTVSDVDKVSGYITDEDGKEVYIQFKDWWIVDPITSETIIKIIHEIELRKLIEEYTKLP